jgi:hypothetical protein
MTCKRTDILKILKDNDVDLQPRSNLAKLVALFSDNNVTVKQRQLILNTVIASALQTRNNLLADAYGTKVPKTYKIEFIPIEITSKDIRGLLRHTRTAARNILANTIGIGKPDNKSFLRDFVEASKRKLTEMFETSTTLREFMDTDSGKAFLEKATDQDKNALRFIITSSRNLNDWFFTGADGKPVLSYMNKDTQFIFKKVGINGQTHTTKSGKKITPKDITDSFRYFLEGDIETGDFNVDSMVLEAINQAIYTWQSTLAAETFTNDDSDINRIFGRDSRTQVKPHERRQFAHIGAVQATVIERVIFLINLKLH